MQRVLSVQCTMHGISLCDGKNLRARFHAPPFFAPDFVLKLLA